MPLSGIWKQSVHYLGHWVEDALVCNLETIGSLSGPLGRGCPCLESGIWKQVNVTDKKTYFRHQPFSQFGGVRCMNRPIGGLQLNNVMFCTLLPRLCMPLEGQRFKSQGSKQFMRYHTFKWKPKLFKNFRAPNTEHSSSKPTHWPCIFVGKILVSVGHALNNGGTVAEWVRSLDWRPGGPGFESCWRYFASELWQFHLSQRPTLPASFVGDTKSRRSLLSGVYARGSKISHTGGKCVTCHGLHNSRTTLTCV